MQVLPGSSSGYLAIDPERGVSKEPNPGTHTRSHLCAHGSSKSDLGNGGAGIRGGSPTRCFVSIFMISYTSDHYFRALSPIFRYFNTTGRTEGSGVPQNRQEMDLRMVAVTCCG